MCYTKLNSLQWNKFRITHIKAITAEFYVTVITQELSFKQMREKIEFNRDLVMSMHNAGMSNRAICDYLNDNNILTFRQKRYSVDRDWETVT